MILEISEYNYGSFVIEGITNHCIDVMISRTPFGNFILSLYAKQNFAEFNMFEFYTKLVPDTCKEQGIEVHFKDYAWSHATFERDEDYTWFMLRWS